ncbi:metallophosphoesterase family protein [Brevibacillus daliensis]|uniref:metallophosphoesterase family protein n=1 Tax=Brevibacillus daliensis TaxID=2892995 RepID=UPI001E30F4EF|nr:metallophosphoesterase family protein [Brevibacillus daliensis]
MERIAVISDIHGNIPALESVLQDISSKGIKTIYCLGDLPGKGPNSAEVVDLIRKKCEVIVQGNWDDFIGNPTEVEMIRWHQEQLGKERIYFLKNLPFSFDFWISGKLIRLFHASAESVYKRVRAHSPLEERLAMFVHTEMTGTAERNPDVVMYGDIHHAFIQQLSKYTLCNVGSVGNPLDITQASYAIIEGERNSKVPSSFSMTLVRVPYDIDYALQLAKEAQMPEYDAYEKELRTARYRGLPDLIQE